MSFRNLGDQNLGTSNNIVPQSLLTSSNQTRKFLNYTPVIDYYNSARHNTKREYERDMEAREREREGARKREKGREYGRQGGGGVGGNRDGAQILSQDHLRTM